MQKTIFSLLCCFLFYGSSTAFQLEDRINLDAELMHGEAPLISCVKQHSNSNFEAQCSNVENYLHDLTSNNTDSAVRQVLNICNTKSKTALHYAIKRGCKTCATKLFNAGGGCMEEGRDVTAFVALEKESVCIFDFLQSDPSIVNTCRGELEETPSMAAAQVISSLGRSFLTHLKKEHFRKRDVDGFNTLHHATMACNPKAIRIILQSGINVDTKSKNTKETSLAIALNTAGALNEEAPDEENLNNAIKRRQKLAKAITMLIRAGANPLEINANGNSSINAIIKPSCVDFLRARLDEHTIDLNKLSINGMVGTALDIALSGATQNLYSVQAIYTRYPSKTYDKALCQFLLQSGAQPSKDVMDILVEEGDMELLDLLQDYKIPIPSVETFWKNLLAPTSTKFD